MCSVIEIRSCFTGNTRPVTPVKTNGGKSCKMKERDCDIDKGNISMVICDTDIP